MLMKDIVKKILMCLTLNSYLLSLKDLNFDRVHFIICK